MVRLVPAFVLLAAALLAWANSFSGPFVFDDRPAILANPSLESFSTALSPPRDGGTVAGRPLVNLSLALNRALSGNDVWSYHAVNLLIHVLNSWLLFGILRRTFDLIPALRIQARWAALAAALLWLVHPLQTSAVTYIVQRAESLMALCFLATLYSFIRATTASDAAGETSTPNPNSRRWTLASLAACFLGMTAKEVMVAAPLVVLLYDRTFVAGTFAASLRMRRRYYGALAGSWVLLAVLVAMNAGRAGTAGFASSVSPWDYALTQCSALVTYLKLAVWPSPLVFDYGTAIVMSFSAVWPQAIVVVGLIGGVVIALRRSPRIGFLGAAFLLILAPTTSIVPIATQTIAEHRMYLPLAVLTTVLACALFARWPRVAVIATACVAVALGSATAARNRDYASAITLWSDTTAKRPGNARAHNHLGNAFAQSGQPEAALEPYRAASRLAPTDFEAVNNLASALGQLGRSAEAITHYERAVALRPDFAPVRLNLANALVEAGRSADALPHYRAAEKSGALDAEAECGYGVALASTGALAEAVPHYERAIKAKPDHVSAHYNLGLAHARQRQYAPAADALRGAVRLQPSHVAARVNLGNVLLLAGRNAEAITEYEAALQLRPGDPQITANLARARRGR